ncbi:MAG: FAD-dependent oxidoreductase [Methylotetracoccus sp.]
MRIAVVGSGIAGLTCASRLAERHELTVYESADRCGGHTHTHDIELGARHYAIDSGFIVFNDRTYPNFIALLNQHQVASQTTDMSFAVSCRTSGLEYNGHNLDTLFAQRRNIVNPRFLRMLRDILRFNREAPGILSSGDSDESLGDYIERHAYSAGFRDDYLLPMAAAIWSADPALIAAMPMLFFVRFFANHGLLTVTDHPQWRVIRGGSREYVSALTRPFADRIRVGCGVSRIERSTSGVTVHAAAGSSETFDQVILACHSDQALGMLADPSPEECQILGAIPYRSNHAVLHTDSTVLPRIRRAWAAWNYTRDPAGASVSYNMNLLQGISAPDTFIVTLNPTGDIREDLMLAEVEYHHPVFTAAGVAAQRRWHEINGTRRTWYAGAYWGYGFHEDGVNSALRVADAMQQLERP